MSAGPAAEVGTDRFDVRSPDGTPIAVWADGNGPPLVLVHGSLTDHTTFDPLVDQLRGGVTCFSMDRRGFGASGDAAGYAIQREFEDVAAVVAAVADRTGGPAALWGDSYGAGCAMGGTALTNKVRRLVLYEPGFGIAYPAGSIEAIEEAMAAGDRETAILAVLVGIVGMTEEEVDALRSSPRWANPPGRHPDDAQGVQSRGQLGLPAWPARQHHGPDTPAGGLREPSRADQGNASGSGRDPRCSNPSA